MPNLLMQAKTLTHVWKKAGGNYGLGRFFRIVGKNGTDSHVLYILLLFSFPRALIRFLKMK